MKSKAQKRREARERIERKIPDVQAELALVRSAIRPRDEGNVSQEQLSLLERHRSLVSKLSYMTAEIENIKNKEAGRGARRDPHPEIQPYALYEQTGDERLRTVI